MFLNFKFSKNIAGLNTFSTANARKDNPDRFGHEQATTLPNTAKSKEASVLELPHFILDPFFLECPLVGSYPALRMCVVLMVRNFRKQFKS